MEKKIFTDDVIQRITSGYEPEQTKISYSGLKEVLDPYQLRNVLGGSNGGCDTQAYGTCSGECISSTAVYGTCEWVYVATTPPAVICSCVTT